MSTLTPPVLAHIDLTNGVITEAAEAIERRLSDMPAFFQDQEAVQALLADDPVLYRVYVAEQPNDAEGWYTATSVIEPGRVGDEYYMTKGHFHIQDDAPEVYLTLSGQGILVMQTRTDEATVHPMRPGTINYIPGGRAHRTVNTGDEPLVFFAVWPVSAGHDYDTLAERGFVRLVLVGADGPQVVTNPRYGKERGA